MNQSQKDLWIGIKTFEIGDPKVSFSFTDRLARENGWSMEYALRVILEYKKFIFLICVADHSCTPSDQVDQVWHLHLLYTRSYWEDFCETTLGMKIQHGPTKGGESEKVKYHELYERTKSLYTRIFNRLPPSDIWPESQERFSQIRFQRVNMHQYWIWKKPTIFSRLFRK